MKKNRALIVIDVQNDFLPGGALAVPKGDEVIPVINRLLKLPFKHVIATRDFHPQNHSSFASTWGKKVGERIVVDGEEQILWPDHCVQGTKGAEFPLALDSERFEKVVYHKGTDKDIDSYSAFAKGSRETGAVSFLRKEHVGELYFVGLATDYCVLYSILDALQEGFTCFIVLDGCRGVDLTEHDVDRALEQMQAHGAKLITEEEVTKLFACVSN